MYKDLPYDLQDRVKEFLEKDEFFKAKAIHDAWLIENEHIMRRQRSIMI
jgi:hypothetical protein